MLSKLHEKSLKLLLLILNDNKLDSTDETELELLLIKRVFDCEIKMELFWNIDDYES